MIPDVPVVKVTVCAYRSGTVCVAGIGNRDSLIEVDVDTKDPLSVRGTVRDRLFFPDGFFGFMTGNFRLMREPSRLGGMLLKP